MLVWAGSTEELTMEAGQEKGGTDVASYRIDRWEFTGGNKGKMAPNWGQYVQRPGCENYMQTGTAAMLVHMQRPGYENEQTGLLGYWPMAGGKGHREKERSLRWTSWLEQDTPEALMPSGQMSPKHLGHPSQWWQVGLKPKAVRVEASNSDGDASNTEKEPRMS